MAQSALLETRALSVRLGGQDVLSAIDFAIGAGEIVTILGPNGSGKSTLLRALLGILPPGRGTVERAPGLRIGYVPQKLALERNLPMTVRRFLSLPKRVSDAEAEAALTQTGLPLALQDRQLAALSGGQLQRVLLARALLSKPHLLVLDEATQGLDQPGEAAFYQLIEEIRASTGAAVLMVSHDLHVVMAASDRVICLNGHICCEGTPRVVSTAPEYRALFGLGTRGALALYRHEHDHDHDHPHDHGHDHPPRDGERPSAALDQGEGSASRAAQGAGREGFPGLGAARPHVHGPDCTHQHGAIRSHDHDHGHGHGQDEIPAPRQAPSAGSPTAAPPPASPAR